MKYILTGLPRTRSAWLAALFTTDDVPCLHDDIEKAIAWSEEGRSFGLSGSGIIAANPDLAVSMFAGCPGVIVFRDPDASKKALEKRYNMVATEWQIVYRHFLFFGANRLDAYTKRVPVEALDSYDVVNDLYRHCLGPDRTLARDRFDLFYGLKIEQFSEKLYGGESWRG